MVDSNIMLQCKGGIKTTGQKQFDQWKDEEENQIEKDWYKKTILEKRRPLQNRSPQLRLFLHTKPGEEGVSIPALPEMEIPLKYALLLKHPGIPPFLDLSA